MRVCVAGAGFAGLAAADSLARAGADVVVLEAAGRLGGRVWSERLEGGGLVERGGEFITSGYDVTEDLAERFGLPLDGMGISYPDRELAPDPGLGREEVVAAAAIVARAAAASPAAPAPEVLAAVSDPDLRDLLASRVQSAVAYPFERLRGRWLTKLPSLVEALETRRIRGGNQRLAAALAAALPRPPAMNVAVRSVSDEGEEVRVLAGGDEVVADACVVAVPCLLLGEIDFAPRLPAEVESALSSIPMSSAAKLAAELRRPEPSRAVMSVPHRFWAWTTPCDEVGGRVVGSWAGAEPVLAALDVGGRDPARWLTRLSDLWPELEIAGESALLTVWDGDSWSRGAYSVLRNSEEGPRTAGSPRVVFAGEHTAAEWSGTMEGALRSGLRAAADVLAPR